MHCKLSNLEFLENLEVRKYTLYSKLYSVASFWEQIIQKWYADLLWTIYLILFVIESERLITLVFGLVEAKLI